MITDLHLWLRDENPYAESYQCLHDKINEWRRKNPNEEIPIFTLKFNHHLSLDQRTYNAPAANEVAAIIFGNEIPDKFDSEKTVYVTHRYIPEETVLQEAITAI